MESFHRQIYRLIPAVYYYCVLVLVPYNMAADGLMCACTYPQAKYCTPEGVCNATRDAAGLREYLRSTEQFRSRTWQLAELSNLVNPERSVWEGICRDLTADTYGAYFVIEEFQNWEPVCAFDGQLETCSLAPSRLDPLPVTANGLRMPDGCLKAGFKANLLRSDWTYCRHSDYCNGLQQKQPKTSPTVNSPEFNSISAIASPINSAFSDHSKNKSSLTNQGTNNHNFHHHHPEKRIGPTTNSDQGSSGFVEDDESKLRRLVPPTTTTRANKNYFKSQEFMIIIVSAIAGAIVLISLIGCLCYKLSLWSYIYRVDKRQQDRRRWDELYRGI